MVKYAYESGHDVRLFTTLQGLSLAQFHEIEDIPFRLVVLHLPDQKGYAHYGGVFAAARLCREEEEKGWQFVC